MAGLDDGPAAAAAEPLGTDEVIGLFLEFCEAAVAREELEPVTLEGYRRYLTPANAAMGRIPADRLRPKDVMAWLDARKTWGPTSRFNAVTAIKRAFRWAKRAGHLESNPIADLEKPTPRRREAVPEPEQVEALREARPDEAFRDLIAALVETGCRPGEVIRLTAAQVDLARGVWVVPNKTRRKTGEPTRDVVLIPSMVERSRRLAERWPEGPIFRNSSGTPWTRHTIAHRFGRLRERLGLGKAAAAYALRHAYVTDALERGVPIATVAELVGHKDTTMILRTYSKLSKRTEHLRDAARQVRPDPE